MKNKITIYTLLFCLLQMFNVHAQSVSKKQLPLSQLQQSFVDLRFGMFIHFGIATYFNQDWPDPEAPASAFNPTKLDCDQWAKAAKSANMSYGCLTTKHHSGFCIGYKKYRLQRNEQSFKTRCSERIYNSFSCKRIKSDALLFYTGYAP